MHTWNYKLFANNKVRHHLLEIILWPNEDGTLTKIISRKTSEQIEATRKSKSE